MPWCLSSAPTAGVIWKQAAGDIRLWWWIITYWHHVYDKSCCDCLMVLTTQVGISHFNGVPALWCHGQPAVVFQSKTSRWERERECPSQQKGVTNCPQDHYGSGWSIAKHGILFNALSDTCPHSTGECVICIQTGDYWDYWRLGLIQTQAVDPIVGFRPYASACHLKVSLSCAVLCQIVLLQYLSRSSLHSLADLPLLHINDSRNNKHVHFQNL